MLFHIATVVSCSLLSVTAVEFQRHSAAISSQSFHRDDIPLSYKFSAIHEYTSPKTVQDHHEPHLYDRNPSDPESPKIQYAPLTGLYAKYYGTKGPKVQDLNLRNDHLEPRPNQRHRNPMPEGHVHSTAQALQAHGDLYIPGHNIETMQKLEAVTRFPAHNAVYQGYKEKEFQNKNIHHMGSSTPRLISAVEAINRYATDNTGDGRLPEKQKLVLYNLAPYTKKHSLFLNVARTYNFEPKSQEAQVQLRDQALVQLRDPALVQLRDPALVQLRDATLMAQSKNPEILRNPNTHSVIFSQKIKAIPCYGCGVEYNLYKH